MNFCVRNTFQISEVLLPNGPLTDGEAGNLLLWILVDLGHLNVADCLGSVVIRHRILLDVRFEFKVLLGQQPVRGNKVYFLGCGGLETDSGIFRQVNC